MEGSFNHIDSKIKFIENNNFSKSKRLVIILLGKPGVGKGTQGKKLQKLLNIPHISIGDLFRHHTINQTDLGKLIINYKSFGNKYYPPDEICLGIMSRRLIQEDCKKGFILDGFPRSKEQAEVLVGSLLRSNDLTVAIYIDLDESIIESRIKDRRICSNCGAQFNITGTCVNNNCKEASLIIREEDCKSNLNKRLQLFNDSWVEISTELEKISPVQKISLSEVDSENKTYNRLTSIIYSKMNKN